MPLKCFRAWVDQTGHLIADTDNKRYSVACERCDTRHAEGSNRFGGEFLCDGCLRRRIGADEARGAVAEISGLLDLTEDEAAEVVRRLGASRTRSRSEVRRLAFMVEGERQAKKEEQR